MRSENAEYRPLCSDPAHWIPACAGMTEYGLLFPSVMLSAAKHLRPLYWRVLSKNLNPRPSSPAIRARRTVAATHVRAQRVQSIRLAGRRRVSSGTNKSKRPASTSNSTRSPSRTSASGPPTAASGATCKATVPYAVPLIRPSETRTMSSTPWAARYLGKGMDPASGIPRALVRLRAALAHVPA